jgi:predicted nucleic acid-binding protein
MRAVVDTNIPVRATLRPRGTVGPVLADAVIPTTLRLIVEWGELVIPDERIAACRDPKDDKFLEAAIAGDADVIVSGDRDLEVLSPFRSIPIVGPLTFLRMLTQS